MGLSPRVRGNPHRLDRAGDFRRSIPARAGEPRPSGTSATRSRVYPRACGGTRLLPAPGGLDLGLSPRVRGNPRDLGRGHALRGSIPARAGEPSSSRLRGLCVWVYPRACGGTALVGSPTDTARGLSPRVRGNRIDVRPDRRGIGSIPARAGEPGCRASFSWAPRVYPRACGGTHDQIPQVMRDWGLSPRVRGNLRRKRERKIPYRSIPARAGEPVQICTGIGQG